MSAVTVDAFPLLRGMSMGLAIAMPIGPSCLLCLQRSLCHGTRSGLATGFGIVTVHTVYAAVAAVGAGALTGALVSHGLALRLLAGGMLIWLAMRAALRPMARPQNSSATLLVFGVRDLTKTYASAVLFASLNPITILFFLAVIPVAFVPEIEPCVARPVPLLLITGVAMGSALWWTSLTMAATSLRALFMDGRRLKWINRCFALLLAGAGLSLVLSG